MTRLIPENLTSKDTAVRLYSNSGFFFSDNDKMISVRTFYVKTVYPLAGCAAHLRASITEIAQLQQPYKNLPGEIVSISPLPPVFMEK